MHGDGLQTPTGGAARPSEVQEARIGGTLRFGSYVAFPSARTLLLDGSAVCIGARAFDLLILLLARQGSVVCKEEIMRHVWPTTTVDESNLRFQMTSLRKALGQERGRIKTVTGRGYLFAADDAEKDLSLPAASLPAHERQQRPTARKPAIVIIDENPDSRDALQRLLRPFDAYVHAFVSVEAFVASGSHVSEPALTA